MNAPTKKTDATAKVEASVVDEWPMRVKLTKKILDKDAVEIDTIEFREPTGADIVACGMPVTPSFDTGLITFDGQKMTAMMSRLSSVPMPFMQKMSTVDWTTCATKLQRFFLPDLERLLS